MRCRCSTKWYDSDVCIMLGGGEGRGAVRCHVDRSIGKESCSLLVKRSSDKQNAKCHNCRVTLLKRSGSCGNPLDQCSLYTPTVSHT